jgi:ribosomal protein L24E
MDCNYCGKNTDGKEGAMAIYVQGEVVAHYCSPQCWTKALKKMEQVIRNMKPNATKREKNK